MTMLKYSLVIFDDLNFIILIWTSRLKLMCVRKLTNLEDKTAQNCSSLLNSYN